MYLKKIELQGFKSFPDKTIVEFKDGITGIVGPNGSGKSNISDAVRWCLGEQSSRTLRGQKMEDVIFAGSGKRKALGFAEVTMTFDNSDGRIPIEFNEVSVKRRVFRSGESEYSINNSACRLKDVRDLFMDTGIGKDGYSIVGQGKIDEILSNKPEERRAIFEEAAGIIKYRSRKEEAERKLKLTEANVNRVEDILLELQDRHDILKKDAAKAEKYQDINDSLNAMELDLLIRDIKLLKEKVDSLKKNKKNLQEEELILEESLLRLDGSIKESEKEIEEKDISIREADFTYGVNNEELLSYNKKKTILEESSRYKKLDNERLEEESGKKKEIIINNNEENKKQIEENKELELGLKSKMKSYDLAEKEVNELKDLVAGLEETIDEKKEGLSSFYNELTDKRGELSNLINFKKTILNQSTNIEDDIRIINENRKTLDSRKTLILKKSLDLKKEEENLKIAKDKSVEELDKSEKRLKTFKKDLEDTSIKLNINKSEYSMNFNMQENYEGYFRSVKALMVNAKKEKKLEENIIGVVGDLMEVKEDYTKAIDIALGSNIQNIVTPNEEAAKKLIDYLKFNKLGRATFLPLNIIRSRKFDLSSVNYEDYGLIGLASDIIDYDPKYKNIFESLLGRVVITRDIDGAVRLAKHYNHSVRIVSLEGDLINPGGSMTGGSIHKKSNNILTRKNILKDLESDREKLLLNSKNLEKNLSEELTNYNKLEDELKKIEVSLRDISLDLHRFKNEEESIGVSYKEVLAKRSKLDKDFQYFSKESTDMEEKISLLKTELETMELKKTELDRELDKLMFDFKDRERERDRKRSELTDLKIEIKSLEEEYKYKAQRLENILEANKKLEEEIDRNSQKIDLNKAELLKNSKEIDLLKSKIDNLTQLNQELKLRREGLEVARNELNKDLQKLKNTKLNKFKDLEDLKSKLNKLNLDLAKEEIHLDNYLEEMRDGHNLDYKDNMPERFVELAYEDLETRVKKSKKAIEALGLINLGAIDEYEIVRDRLDFINDQIGDLNKAKEDLLKIIREMNQKMTYKFMDSFKLIRKNFNQVFSILFNGGKADLILENEKDILNSGIEIKAQPPGKKFQSLSLLSGGERSLTAVALLFSILEMKPSPFCILDEIDAALDDSNIDRYTSYLKKFSHDTQFIMITHRKRTMEISDTIYGVTMEEEGVSKTVSIELEDIEE